MEDTGHSGFTLIELLLVMSLVALLAGLAVPAMSYLIDTARLRGAVETLVQELRQARNQALILQQPVYFSFSRRSAKSWCYGWRTQTACDCRITVDKPAACLDSKGAGTHWQRQRSSSFPAISLGTVTGATPIRLQFGAIRGTARAGSISLSNAAGEVHVIISPLGRVHACARHGQAFTPC